jgi:hypothetical protein
LHSKEFFEIKYTAAGTKIKETVYTAGILTHTPLGVIYQSLTAK